MLEELAVLAAGRRDLVTYNGGSFDLPLLETRFAPERRAFSLPERPPSGPAPPGAPAVQAAARERPAHPHSSAKSSRSSATTTSRGTGSRRCSSTSSATETTPPWNRCWRTTATTSSRWPRSRSGRSSGWTSDWHSDDPADLHGAGHHFWRRGESEVAIPLLERALSAGLSGRNRDRCLLDLGERRKQLGDWTGAVDLWRRGQRRGLPGAVGRARLVREARRTPAEGSGPGRSLTSRTPSNGSPGSTWAGRRAAATGKSWKGAPPGSRRAWADSGARKATGRSRGRRAPIRLVPRANSYHQHNQFLVALPRRSLGSARREPGAVHAVHPSGPCPGEAREPGHQSPRQPCAGRRDGFVPGPSRRYV